MNIAWKCLFSTGVHNRGHDYFLSGAVHDIKYSNNELKAVVSGSKYYIVRIVFSEDDEIEILDMDCTCPYACDGYNCKHMAAALYKFDECRENGLSFKNATDILLRPAYTKDDLAAREVAIKKLIAYADNKTVRSFLAEVLASDDKLCMRFYNIQNKLYENIDVDKYFKHIDLIIKRYAGYDNFLDRYKANDFMEDIEDIIDNDLRMMIDNENYINAFEISCYIFTALSNIDTYDCDYEIEALENDITLLWSALIKKANYEDKHKMFEWFTAHHDVSICDYSDGPIEDVIINEFKGKEFEKDKRDFFTKMLRQSEKLDDDFEKDYAVNKWALVYLDFIAGIDSYENIIENEFRKYCIYPDIRKRYVDRCLQNNEYDKAINLLDEGIIKDADDSSVVSYYIVKKKEIYLKTGDRDNYLKQLWNLVLKNAVGNMDIYRELRQQYDEAEWCKLRENIFKSISPSQDLAKYYKEEKLYDRLLICIEKSTGFFTLEEYADVLKNIYPEQILYKYRIELEKSSSYAGGRQHYADMVAIMRKMKKISGGQKVVNEIAEEWRKLYKNRRAMMDELGKL